MAKNRKKKALSRTKRRTVSNNGLDNTFRMVVLASRRAKELLMGEKSLIETNNVHPCLIAIEEIRKGMIKYKKAE